MYPIEHKTLPPPNYHQENVDLLRARRNISPQTTSTKNQFRPSQPDTNPKIRKNGKAAEKRKRPIPTKRFKVAAWSNSNKMTEKPSNMKVQVNTKNQETQAQTSQNKLPLLEDAQIHTGPNGPKQGECQETYLKLGKTS